MEKQTIIRALECEVASLELRLENCTELLGILRSPKEGGGGLVGNPTEIKNFELEAAQCEGRLEGIRRAINLVRSVT